MATDRNLNLICELGVTEFALSPTSKAADKKRNFSERVPVNVVRRISESLMRG